MTTEMARLVAWLGLGYFGVGIVFAAFFVIQGSKRLDPAATLLWPLLTAFLLKARRTPTPC